MTDKENPTDLTTNATGQELVPYDRQRTLDEARFYMRQSAVAGLEADICRRKLKHLDRMEHNPTYIPP